MFRRAGSRSRIRPASYSKWSRPTHVGFGAFGSAICHRRQRLKMNDRRAAIAGALRVGRSGFRARVLVARVQAWLDRLSPWRARGYALLLGALAALALPPIYAVPVLLISFSGLVL